MADVTRIAPGRGRTVLVVVAHADDPTLFLGGTIARWSDEGWRVVVVRVTDDRWDSVGLDAPTTVRRNREEYEAAMAMLGVAELVDLGYATDVLGDASEVGLREQVIRLVRTHRPYALATFDPYGMFGEDNQDHLMVAAATDEAFWASQFDKHHPEHLVAGLAPHGAFERWYFARRVVDVTDVVDVTVTVERKVEAALRHDTMLRHFVHQLRMQAATGGYRVPLLDAARHGDLRPVVEPLLRAQAERVGAPHGLAAAEEFRVVRFGGLAGWLDQVGVPDAAGGGT